MYVFRRLSLTIFAFFRITYHANFFYSVRFNSSGVMLSPQQKDQCLKILDELISHPISNVFIDPVDPVLDEVPDYLDVIQEPSDLTTVREKLIGDQFPSLQEFKRQVNLIWENAIQYNGKSSYPGFIADQLSKIFSKRFTELEEPRPEQWMNEFLKQRSIICKLFHNQPKGIALSIPPNSPMAFLYDSMGSNNLENIQIQKDSNYLNTQLDFFKENENLLRNPEIYSKMINIFSTNEPDIDTKKPGFVIDLSKLQMRTIRMLQNLLSASKET